MPANFPLFFPLRKNEKDRKVRIYGINLPETAENWSKKHTLQYKSGIMTKDTVIDLQKDATLNIDGSEITLDKTDTWNNDTTINLSSGKLVVIDTFTSPLIP